MIRVLSLATSSQYTFGGRLAVYGIIWPSVPMAYKVFDGAQRHSATGGELSKIKRQTVAHIARVLGPTRWIAERHQETLKSYPMP